MRLSVKDTYQLVKKEYIELVDRDEGWCYQYKTNKTINVSCSKQDDGLYLFSFPVKNSEYNYTVLLDNKDEIGKDYIKTILHNYL
jgi:hypothetical protein